jgi:hypothetical protein
MNAIATTAPPLAYGDLERLADSIAKSGLFGIKTKEQAIVLMMISHAEGRHPALAARDFDIINGRPAKKAEAMMRDFVQAGGKVEWHALTDELADATFTHPQTGSVRIDWDMKRATTAFGKKDMYAKFPRQMLRSRVVSEGVRTLWPLATSGFHVPEEMADMKPANDAEHNGPTIEAEAPRDRHAEINNREVPLRAAAATMPRGATVREPAAGPTARNDEQWRVWLDKLRAACEVLYRRDEVVELGNRASVGDAIAGGPEWVRAEISRILAENYARFPEEPELPDVEIAGEAKVLAG